MNNEKNLPSPKPVVIVKMIICEDRAKEREREQGQKLADHLIQVKIQWIQTANSIRGAPCSKEINLFVNYRSSGVQLSDVQVTIEAGGSAMFRPRDC